MIDKHMTDETVKVAPAQAHALEHVHDENCNHGHDHHVPVTTLRRAAPKVGRNDACPCGSGKKHKKCCMA